MFISVRERSFIYEIIPIRLMVIHTHALNVPEFNNNKSELLTETLDKAVYILHCVDLWHSSDCVSTHRY